MDVSVCIVNWNTRELLQRCLASIRDLTAGIRYEVIVVDNASSDGSGEMVMRDFPDFRLIASNENLGFARGSNLAASHSLGRFILYLNPDTELVTNALRGMAQYLDSNKDCGAVGCMLLNTDGSIQTTCASRFPGAWNELCSMLWLHRLLPGSAAFSAREMDYWDHRESCDIECLSGACMMLPRALADRLGGFDEALFMYGEDLDLCARVSGEKLRLHYLASEWIFHHEGAGSRKRGRSFAPLRQRAANHYVLRKQFGWVRAAGYRAAVLIGSSARLIGGATVAPALLLGSAETRTRIGDFFAKNVDLLLWSLGFKSVALR